MPNNKYDIYERIFSFVVQTINLVKFLPKTEPNRVITSQLLRSVTSMGANAQEADGVSSKKDFVHCFTIVRKEGKETIFWIKLIGATNNVVNNKTEVLLKENGEIVAIVSKIIQNSRKNQSVSS